MRTKVRILNVKKRRTIGDQIFKFDLFLQEAELTYELFMVNQTNETCFSKQY